MAGQPAQGHYVEQLGLLPNSDVEETLCAAGIDPTGLTGSLRGLLSKPLHLHMLVALQERGKLDPAGITTRLQLFDTFYATVRAEAEALQPNAPVTEVSGRLAKMLSERQELSAAASRLEDLQMTVERLARAGWLRLDGGRVAFAHEAFFDYAYARQHMRTGLPLLTLLRSGEQLLFRRAQVRQILALEREQDRRQYLSDVREILAADDVRPHLKELVVALVTLVARPWPGRMACAQRPGGPHERPARRARLLARRSGRRVQPTAARQRDGQWVPVRPGHRGPRDLALHADGAAHPDEVAALLLPYAARDGWSGRLARVLNAAPLARSEAAVTLMIAFIDAGGLDEAVRGPEAQRRRLHPHARVQGRPAASGSRLVAAWLRRRLALLAADGAYGPTSGPRAAKGPQRRRPGHGGGRRWEP